MIKTNKGQRKGQTLFNFLQWLRKEKGIDSKESHRMADPFYLSDEKLDKLFNEYLKIK